MWIMLNDAFVSIVDDEARKLSNGVSASKVDKLSPFLLVRARRRLDIERFMGALFNTVTIESTPNRDYQFRARVKREIVANLLLSRAMTVDYGNFKSSSKDHQLHDAYMRVWTAMNDGLSPRRGSYGRRTDTFDELMHGKPVGAPDFDDGIDMTRPVRFEKVKPKKATSKKKGR